MRHILLLLLLGCALIAAGQSRSIQERLGYPKGAKLVIIHADDLGVTHSETSASIASIEKGAVNSGSMMVPCPWFSEIAAYAAAHPHADLGLHITLTSEWKYYKWGPVTSREQVPSLVNKQGLLYSTGDSVIRNATAGDVETEIRNQVVRAMQFGLRPTHLDAHMFVALHKLDFLKAYLKVGHEFHIPLFIPRIIEADLHAGLDTVVAAQDLIVDYLLSMEPDDFKSGSKNFYTSGLKNLKPGLTYCFIHPAYDDAEMRAVTVGFTDWGAQWRQQEFDFFSSDECKRMLKENNIYVVTWKEISEKIRQ